MALKAWIWTLINITLLVGLSNEAATSVSSTNSTAIDAFTPIVPFHLNGYTYTVDIDSNLRLPFETSFILRSAILNSWLNRKKNVRVPPSSNLNEYTGDVGQIKIAFHFVMQGGPPLTYGQCANAILKLAEYMQSHPDVNKLALHATISVGNDPKIMLSIEEARGEDADFTSVDGTLAVEAQFYPQRPLPAPAVRDAINALKRDDDLQVSRSSPNPATVAPGAIQAAVRRNVVVHVQFTPHAGEGGWPVFTYENLGSLMEGILGFFEGRGGSGGGGGGGGEGGVWADLWGVIYTNGRRKVDVGLFRVETDVRGDGGGEAEGVAID